MKKALEEIRRISFWTVDAIKGGAVRKHYRDISGILEEYKSSESIAKRAEYLNGLLDHAVSTTQFYSSQNGFKDLDDFPVINKIVLRDNLEAMQSAKYKNKTTYKMSSSGSTGITSTTYQDKNKRNRNTADTLYFQGKAGFVPGYRLYYLRKWLEKYKANGLITWMRNIVMVDVSKFNDNYLSKLVDSMRQDTSTKVILGYSSALRDICQYLERTNSDPLNTNFSCIIAVAESISDNTRKSLERYFNTAVVSRYSNLENGIFALQFPNEGNAYHLNWASYHFEVLGLKDDTPVQPGELGRVVVTDLFNYSMPVIRYDTGDLAILSEDNHHFNKAPVFTKVEGRKMDMIYDTQGNPRSSFIVGHLESYSEIKQFQFIQEDIKKYTLKLNTDGALDFEDDLIQIYKEYLGEDADIHFEYVTDIPQLASGKRRLTVNNYYN